MYSIHLVIGNPRTELNKHIISTICGVEHGFKFLSPTVCKKLRKPPIFSTREKHRRLNTPNYLFNSLHTFQYMVIVYVWLLVVYRSSIQGKNVSKIFAWKPLFGPLLKPHHTQSWNGQISAFKWDTDLKNHIML